MSFTDIAAIFYLLFIGLFILVGNCFVFIAVLWDNKLRSKSNAFILCLSAADLLVAIFNIPLTIASVLHPTWRSMDSRICQFSGFFEMLFLVASVQSLSIIGINRFYYVVHWKRYHERFTNIRVTLIIIGVWALSVLLCTPPLLGWSRYGYKATKNHCFVVWRSDAAYTYFMVLTCFMGPIFAMGICYYRIFKFNRERKKNKFSWLQRKPSTIEIKDNLPVQTKEKAKFSIQRGFKTNFVLEVSSVAPDSGIESAVKNEPVLCNAKRKTVSFYDNAISYANKDQDNWEVLVTAEYNAVRENSLCKLQCSKTIVEDIRIDGNDEALVSNRVESDASTDSAVIAQFNETKKPENTVAKDTQCKTEQLFSRPSLVRHKLIPETSEISDTDVISDVVVTTAVDLSVEDDTYQSTTSNGDERSSQTQEGGKKKGRRGKGKGSKRRLYSPQISKEERKLSLMLALMVIIFIVAWLPFVVTMFLEFYTTITIPTALDRLSLFVGYTNSLCNPIIYGFMNQRFRKVYKDIFFVITRCKRAHWS
uniref:Biogenic amine-like GPCR n=1 Tax=Tripedalia cystophora TaxID=6141 RepID=A0A481ZQE5_TRICY|nr:biogenic amine-like GPCR [Tripedalia cystophora]